MLLCLCGWLPAQAQQTVVKASSLQSSSSAGITDLTYAYDSGTNYLNTAARITSVYSALSTASNDRYIEIAFTGDVPANTAVYLKMASDPESKVLTGLLGGAIGNLLTGTLNTLTMGSQTITVQALTAAGTGVATSSTFNNEIMKVVTTTAGDRYVRITAASAFRRIKITNHSTSGTLDSDKWLDVYGAYYISGAPTCSSPTYTSYTAGGLLSVVDVSVTSPANAIDGNPATYSNLSLGVLATGEWTEQTIYFEGASSTTDQYNIRLAIPPALLAANLISGITIEAYNGASATALYTTNMGTLLALPANAQVLTLLNSGQPALLSIAPGVAIDRIAIRFTALASLSTSPSVSIYEVSKGFGLNVTGGASVHVNDAVNLVSGVSNTQCNESFTYSWTLTGNSAVLGTGASYAPPTATPGTYNYTLTVTDNFGVVKTATAQVVVQAPPVAGTVANMLLECTDLPLVNLTLTGYTGNVVRWERADNAAFTNAATIASTNAYLTPAQMGTITQTTYFRAFVTQNGYQEVSTPATGGIVSIKTSIWNGSAWSNGTPDIGTIIYINGNYNEDADLTGCRLYVNNNAQVTIPTGRTVHLNKSINVVSGSFTLQNEAHLVQDTATEPNTGNITVKRNASTLYRLDYTFWSAPVTGSQTLTQFSPLTSLNPSRFYTYGVDATSQQEMYLTITSPAATTFTTATGYLIRMPNSLPDIAGYNAGATTYPFEGIFTGVPNNGTITKALNTQASRFTGIGNPYPSPINVHDFFTTNTSVLQPGSAIYFWRKKNNSNASSYATLTWDVYTYNHAIGGNAGEGQYGGLQWDSYFNTGNPANWTINTGQGFLVKTSSTATGSPQVTFNAAMRRGNVHGNQFFKTSQGQDSDEERSRIWIDMQGADAIAQAAIVYSNTATLDIDYGRDAEVILADGSALWSTGQEHNLVVQARPQFTITDVVPMGYKALSAGPYSLVVHRADGIFAQGQDILLRDNLLGTVTSIKETPYSFTTEAGTFNERFEVLYTTDGQLGTNPQELSNTIMVYQNNGAINIATGTAPMNSVAVYDIRGRKLYERNGINATEASISTLNAAQQVLIVEIDTVNGKVSRKIVY